MTITPIYQIKQIRELESLALQKYAISNETMMHNAGKAALWVLKKHWADANNITVICGSGNNGGDGYMLAKIAHATGLNVQVLFVGKLENLKDGALLAYEACKKSNVPIKPFLGKADLENTDIIVDALYGIGLKGDVRPDARLIIETINQSQIPVLALDVPSGIDADTGQVLGVAVKANATITFMGVKLGLLTSSGCVYSGEVVCDDLQLPGELFTLVPAMAETLALGSFASYLKARSCDWHKGTAGHVLVVGGDNGYPGAPRMVAEAALRIGAGLVTVATHPKHATTLNIGRPEIICLGVRSPLALKPLLAKATVVVIGPGLGQSSWGKNLLTAVLKSKKPLIVDADALNLIAQKPFKRSNWIITPHPGEAARLLKTSTASIQQDRLKALFDLQSYYDGVAVLKGAGSLVLAADHLPAICTAGNPGMATAGMGDVLSGVIGGLVAQGIPLGDAAKLGVCLHACAGDLAAKEGERGTVAMDLMPYLRRLVNLDIT